MGPAEAALLAAGRLQVVADGSTVTVAAPDRQGLLAAVAGVLTLCGVTIRSASTMSEPSSGMALLQFQVTPAFDELPDWDRVQADLAVALDGRLALPAKLEDRERHYARYPAGLGSGGLCRRLASPLTISASATSTVVEVRAPTEARSCIRLPWPWPGAGS